MVHYVTLRNEEKPSQIDISPDCIETLATININENIHVLPLPRIDGIEYSPNNDQIC